MQDFRRQDLRGRSFKGQTIADADFTGADLRGADFSGSTVTRAKFSKAHLGKPLRRRLLLLLAALVLGLTGGFYSAVCYYVFTLAFQVIFKQLFQNQVLPIILASLAYLLSMAISLWFCLKKQSWLPLTVFTITFAVALGGAIAVVEAAKNVVGTLALALAGAGAVAGTVALAGALALGGERLRKR